MGHSVQPGQRKLFSGEPSCLETSWTSWQPVCLLQPVLILNFFQNLRQAGLVMMIRLYRQPKKAHPKRPPTKRVSFLLDWAYGCAIGCPISIASQPSPQTLLLQVVPGRAGEEKRLYAEKNWPIFPRQHCDSKMNEVQYSARYCVPQRVNSTLHHTVMY